MAVRTSTRARLRLPRRALWVVADDVLVAQVRAGSRGAFEAIYDRHHAGILSFCRHMLGSREEAEDAVQHTFVAAYQGLLVGEREIAIKAWLYTIARNRCLSVLRARREHAALDDAAAAVPETAGLSAEVERREDLRALLGDLQRLPDDQRAALVLSELAAHSHDEIAAILDVPTTKVKALVFQAREGLMNRRTAREADCAEIREQLTVLRGSARRGLLRHHIAQCEACHAFAAEVRAQQARMALLLPVAPTLALKHSSLSAAFAVGQGGAAATGGAGALGGGAMASAKVLGTKVLISLAVTGAGGGYLAVHELRSETRSSSAPAQATAAPPARGASASAARPAVAAAGRAPAGRSSAAQPCPSGPGGACAARTPGAPDGPGLPNAAQSHDA
ncbi:MAG: hypothetical protein QOE11_1755, partial [Solirubrobacteraceae bacterium]|nr:hypothetical protein [Solirubrobacteraceae bacterium]